ncbi:MAG: hypothetical protein P1P58_05875 [Treponema sp.]
MNANLLTSTKISYIVPPPPPPPPYTHEKITLGSSAMNNCTGFASYYYFHNDVYTQKYFIQYLTILKTLRKKSYKEAAIGLPLPSN